MKTHGWTATVLACAAVAATCTAYAEPPGIRDGEDSFRGFQSQRTRADVMAELAQSHAQGWQPPSDANAWSARSGDIGAFGSPGARYSGRTREEVRAELMGAPTPRERRIDGLENDPMR